MDFVKLHIFLKLVLILLSFNDFCDSQEEELIVYLPYSGRIQGTYLKSAWTNRTIYQFNGIKYGEGVSEEKRFKIPKPVKPWSHLYNGKNLAYTCPGPQNLQKIKNTTNTNYNWEECLYLSVSTTNVSGSKPIMVYLLNNEMDGFYSTGPQYLLEKDIVLVVVSYRYNAFGFLSTQSEEIPGNVALYDIILSLKWIQKHIRYFGGDSNRVTVFGQNLGAALTHALTISPVVPENLFHQVIYHSTSMLSPKFVSTNPLNYAMEILENIEDDDVNRSNMNAILKTVTERKLIEAVINQDLKSNKNVEDFDKFYRNGFVIGPPSDVFPDHPEKLISQSKIRSYPTMGGVVKNVGTYYPEDILPKNSHKQLNNIQAEKLIQNMILKNAPKEMRSYWNKFAHEKLFTKEQLKNNSLEVIVPGLIDLLSTIISKEPILKTLQANAKLLQNQTYLYTFNYYGQYHFYDDNEDEDLFPFERGVSMFDDHFFLFSRLDGILEMDEDDLRIVKLMIDLWTSFATTGIPKCSEIVEWPPLQQEYGPYLVIDEKLKIENNFENEFFTTTKDDSISIMKSDVEDEE